MSFNDEVKFAVKLLELTGNVNVIFSPVSILSGFSLIYFNAKNYETEMDLVEFFGKDKTKEEIIEYFSQFIKRPKDENGVITNCVIKCFVTDKNKLSSDFTKLIKTKFNGEIHEIDGDTNFSKTDGEDDINPPKNNFLVTALNFSAPWQNNFDKAHMQIFYSNPPREIKFMSKAVSANLGWNYIENENWISMGIPYQNFKSWIYIVLPKKNFNLTELIKSLNIDSFNEWTKRSPFPTDTVVNVTIPLFTVSSNIKFKEVLKKMGLNKVFGDTEHDMRFDNYSHTSTFSINERGTQTNITAPKLSRSSVSILDSEFTVDRPFLYFIISNEEKVFNDESATVPMNLLYVGTFY